MLAPFEYELEYSADVARRIGLIRDYREEHGGSLTYHADLYALDDNPEPAALEQASGTRSPSGEVVFDDFLNWSKYNLIIVFTHGGRVECARPVPVGGQEVDFTKNYDGPFCPLITAGRAKQASYGTYRGVELYWSSPRTAGSRRPAGSPASWSPPRRLLRKPRANRCASRARSTSIGSALSRSDRSHARRRAVAELHAILRSPYTDRTPPPRPDGMLMRVRHRGTIAAVALLTLPCGPALRAQEQRPTQVARAAGDLPARTVVARLHLPEGVLDGDFPLAAAPTGDARASMAPAEVTVQNDSMALVLTRQLLAACVGNRIRDKGSSDLQFEGELRTGGAVSAVGRNGALTVLLGNFETNLNECLVLMLTGGSPAPGSYPVAVLSHDRVSGASTDAAFVGAFATDIGADATTHMGSGARMVVLTSGMVEITVVEPDVEGTFELEGWITPPIGQWITNGITPPGDAVRVTGSFQANHIAR